MARFKKPYPVAIPASRKKADDTGPRVHDCSTKICREDCEIRHDHIEVAPRTVEMTVRPGHRLSISSGYAVAGDRVIVDERETRIPAIAATLCTANEYKTLVATEEIAAIPPSPPPSDGELIGDTIARQIEAATKAAVEARKNDPRFHASAAR